MIKSIRPVSVFKMMKFLLIVGLLVYSAVCTVVMLQIKPTTLVIGIDSYGTRVIETKDDHLIRLERHNFVKSFLTLLFNYNSDNFSKNASMAGDMMSSEAWNKRQTEFKQLVSSLKEVPIQQVSEVEDIREIDQTSYEADLKITIRSKLNEKKLRVRVVMNLKPASRTAINPFPWEVSNYEEQVL